MALDHCSGDVSAHIQSGCPRVHSILLLNVTKVSLIPFSTTAPERGVAVQALLVSEWSWLASSAGCLHLADEGVDIVDVDVA